MTKLQTEAQHYEREARRCAASEQCAFDVRRRLMKHSIDAAVIASIIERLTQERFIDHVRFCRAYVHDKATFNRWGVQRIRTELHRRAIPSELIDEALSQLDTTETLEQLRHILEHQYPKIKGRSPYERKSKLIAFALRRGYLAEQIFPIVNQITQGDEDEHLCDDNDTW